MASLIEDLSRRLDTSPDEARELLQELVSAFRSHVERKGRSTLPGLGTFSKADGDWAFNPNEALARSINRSFDDLEPVGVSASSPSDASAASASDEPSRTPSGEEDEHSDSESSASDPGFSEPSEPSDPEGDEPAEPAAESSAPSSEASSRFDTGGSIFDRQDDAGTADADASNTPSRRGLFGRDATEEPPSDEPSVEDSSGEDPFAEETHAEEPFSREASAEASPVEETSPEASPEETPAGEEPPARERFPYEPTPEHEEVQHEEAQHERGDSEASSTPSSPDDSSEGEADTWSSGSDWSMSTPSSSDADATAESADSGGDRSSLWDYAALPAGYLLNRAVHSQAIDVREGRLHAPSRSSDAAPAASGEDARGASADDDRRAPDRSETAPADRERSRDAERTSSSNSSAGWLTGLLVFLLLGLGAWYLLGQQGIVTGPTALFDSSDPAVTAQAGGEAGENTGAGALSDTTTSEADSTSAGAQAFEEAARFDRGQGGWTVVVASETSRDSAQSTAQQFAQQLEGQDYPIDIVEATVNGTQRFRVVVGQFSSPDEVVQLIAQDTDRFPPDAWGLEL